MQQAEALIALDKLEDLWLQGNPCSLSEEYMTNALHTLPKVEYLDGYPRKQILEYPESIRKSTVGSFSRS